MSTTNDSSGQGGADLSPEEFAQIDAALVEWSDAIRAGAKFRIISLAHTDPTTTPSDSLLTSLHGTGVIEAFNALISDPRARATFSQALTGKTKGQGRHKISYVERTLIQMAMRYIAVKDYLIEKHGIEVSGDEYLHWKMTLLDQSDNFLKASKYELGGLDEYAPFDSTTKSKESVSVPNLPILAAIAFLEATIYISEIIDLSIREMVAPLTLDSALQLSEMFTFCETSYALLNIEDIKERAWREILAKNRRDAAAFTRMAIKNKLIALLDSPDNERFRYKEGRRRGRLKIDYIVGRIQKEFESDKAWQRKVPGKTVLRDLIRNFDNSKK